MDEIEHITWTYFFLNQLQKKPESGITYEQALEVAKFAADERFGEEGLRGLRIDLALDKLDEEASSFAWPDPKDREIAWQLRGRSTADYRHYSDLTNLAFYLRETNERCRAARLGPFVARVQLACRWKPGIQLDVEAAMPPPFSYAGAGGVTSSTHYVSNWEAAHGYPWATMIRDVHLGVTKHLASWKRCVSRHVGEAWRRWGYWSRRDLKEWIEMLEVGSEDFEPNLTPEYQESPIWGRAQGGRQYEAAGSTPAPGATLPSGRCAVKHMRMVASILCAAQEPLLNPEIHARYVDKVGGDKAPSVSTVRNAVQTLLKRGLAVRDGTTDKSPVIMTEPGRKWVSGHSTTGSGASTSNGEVPPTNGIGQ